LSKTGIEHIPASREEGTPAVTIDYDAQTITVEALPVDILTCRECGISWTCSAVDYKSAWKASWIDHQRVVHERTVQPETPVLADVSFMDDGSRRVSLGS
jgi:hypothetical protein